MLMEISLPDGLISLQEISVSLFVYVIGWLGVVFGIKVAT